MPIQHPTANDVALAAKRAAFLARHRLKDYRLSAHHLMRMVRDVTADRDVIARIRRRFARGGWLQWPGGTFDHMECLGRDRTPLVFVSHPYQVSSEGRADMELFRSAGLVVVEGGKEASWYGYGTTQLRIEHPAFSGQVTRPAPPPPRPLPESSYTSRLHRAAPALLALAREQAEQLAGAIRMVPCTGAGVVTACVHCEMRAELDRIVSLIAEVEGP